MDRIVDCITPSPGRSHPEADVGSVYLPVYLYLLAGTLPQYQCLGATSPPPEAYPTVQWAAKIPISYKAQSLC